MSTPSDQGQLEQDQEGQSFRALDLFAQQDIDFSLLDPSGGSNSTGSTGSGSAPSTMNG
ncbi:hypothetical protein BGZ96_002798, partial [Linnemannia gamsii]